MKSRTTVIFCIGRELLEGQVLDRNANFMASNLTRLGFRVRTIQVLDEVPAEMVAAFRQAIELGPGYVLTTGGMGPGIHDITRQCAAEAAGLERVLDATAEQYLAASYRRLVAKGVVEDATLTEERLEMARLPTGSICFENMGGTAPAVSFVVGSGTRFFLLPGQPEELRRMFLQFAVPILEEHAPGPFRETVHIESPGGDESLISRLLGDLSRRHPNVTARARMQGSEDDLGIRISLSVEGTDKASRRSALEAACADVRARLGLEVVGPGDGGSDLG